MKKIMVGSVLVAFFTILVAEGLTCNMCPANPIKTESKRLESKKEYGAKEYRREQKKGEVTPKRRTNFDKNPKGKGPETPPELKPM